MEFTFSKDLLRQILIDQHDLFLKRSFGIERKKLTRIGNKIESPQIIVVTGLRRCGKSTFLRQILSHYYNDANFYFINFEDERLVHFPAEKFNLLYETLLELYSPQKTFFIDEIQNITGFERFLRRFMDEGFKFFITGSNAQLLSQEIGSRLTGRHVDILLKPFSFQEFLDFQHVPYTSQIQDSTEGRAALLRHFELYLRTGGMPEYVSNTDLDYLQHLYNDIVIKDIAVRYQIDNLRDLRELYLFLISNLCQRFSFNGLSKMIQTTSANTIKKYIDYLEETYFAIILSKFDYSTKKEIANDKKFYLLDNGFHSLLTRKITPDKGWLLENLVIAHTFDRFELHYFSQKYECDLVLLHNHQAEYVIQISYEFTKENRDRELAGVFEALATFPSAQGLILTYDQMDIVKTEDREIKITPVWKWLLNFE